MTLPVMDLDELRAFIEDAPFRQVKGTPEGPLNKPPQPHEYVIRNWEEIDGDQFGRFAKTIQKLGYKGRYTAPYNDRTMINRYLVVDEHVYWYIYPNSINRTLVADRQHEPLDEQRSFPEAGDAAEEDCWLPPALKEAVAEKVRAKRSASS